MIKTCFVAKSLMSLFCLFAVLLVSGCTQPIAGPDKTATAAVLGAAWGAGSGAVIGNQFANTGPGAAVGAGLGAISGGIVGAGSDIIESNQLVTAEQLKQVELQNLTNARQLARLQDNFDQAQATSTGGVFYQVFFDTDASNLKAGAIANLETIAEALRTSPAFTNLKIIGHSDDAGDPEHSLRLSEARARNVASYVMGRGISADQISVSGKGSTLPIASNAHEAGRQLNRRVDLFIAKR